MSRQIEAGRATILIGLDNKQFNTGISDLHKRLRSVARGATAAGARIAAAGVAIGAAFGALTNTIANVETAVRRFDLIFGDSAGSMRAELKALSKETGVAMTTLVQQAATFGAVFSDIRSGVDDDQFIKIIGKTQKVMLDLAAIGGISVPEAAERLKSAFTSTGESVDQFGFNLRKANLEAEAARQGITESVMTMSEQQKQLLKLSIFMRTTERTGVRFVDMVDTLNGQFTLLRANLLEVVANFGSLISTAFVPVLRLINKIVMALRPIATVLSPLAVLMGPIAAALATLGTALVALGLAGQLLAFSFRGLGRMGRTLQDLIWMTRQLTLATIYLAKVALAQVAAGWARLAPMMGRLSFVTIVTAAFDGLANAIVAIAVAIKTQLLSALAAMSTAYANALRLIAAQGILNAATLGWARLTASIMAATTALWNYVRAAIAAALASLGPVGIVLGAVAAGAAAGAALAKAQQATGDEALPKRQFFGPFAYWDRAKWLAEQRAKSAGIAYKVDQAASLPVATAHAFRGDIGRQLAAPSGTTPEERSANGIEDLRDMWRQMKDGDSLRTV